MKKGQEIVGKVIEIRFPNIGIVETNEGERVVVKNSLPGQTVRARINKLRHGKAEGALLEVLEKSGLTKEDIDLYIPHQANARIIESAVKGLGLTEEKVYVNLENRGNTSSACIPTCLAELGEAGRLKDGMKICLVGFGAGLTSGAIVFEQ